MTKDHLVRRSRVWRCSLSENVQIVEHQKRQIGCKEVGTADDHRRALKDSVGFSCWRKGGMDPTFS